MHIDFALCTEYLHMPESHHPMAQAALDWANGDALATALIEAALEALNRGNRDDATFAFESVKKRFEQAAPQLADGVYPMLFALALPQTLANRRAEGMPEELIRDTVCDYGTWAAAYEKNKGKPGFGEMGWEMNFHSGCIVKLGRIQFECQNFPAPYTVYRHRATGEVIPVAHAGLGVDANGMLAKGDPAVFETVMKIENGALTCNKVDTVQARILPETVSYRLDELEPLLTQGMRVLNMHIPEVGPLTIDGVTESFEMAKEYFSAKGYPCAVAVCESWLLDPALLTYGEGCGNILGFQNRFAKFPWPTDHGDSVNRVFGRGTDASDPDALPEDTRLRRGLKAYLKTGKPLRDAGGLVIL